MPQSQPSNPYIAGIALTGERGFFGREDILRRPDDNAIVLYGQRRIGKTSILKQLQRRLPTPPFSPIYFDLMDMSKLPVGQVLYELATATANAVEVPLPARTDFEDNPEAFRDIFLPALYEAVGDERRPVFLLDEFDVLDIPEQDLPETAAARAFRPYLYRLQTTEPRLAFVFVVGRRMEELSAGFLANFKAASRLRVSVLRPEDARALILQAERDGALRYEEEAVERVLSLTRGHPYLTQLTCQLLFDRAFDYSTDDIPLITVTDVEDIIPDVLEKGGHAFQWIWDGLPPAERIIFSAIATESNEETIFSESDITTVLQDAGIRILVRELNVAPQMLVSWQMLEQVEGGYRFFVELMRRWVAEYRPLAKVKDELDRINPLADALYQTAEQYYKDKNNEHAMAQLRRALDANPNHLKAHLLLGTILRDEDRLDKAVAEFEEAYRLDPPEGRFELLRTLLQQGETLEAAGNEEGALAAYNRALAVSPNEQTAQTRQRALWEKYGDKALAVGNFAAAIEAYRRAQADEKLAEVKTQKLKAELEQAAKEAQTYETREEWGKAANVYRRLTKLDSDDERWRQALKQVEEEQRLAERYAEGAGYAQQKEWEKAQKALARVINKRPDYKNAAALLAQAAQRGKGQLDWPRRLRFIAIGGGIILLAAIGGIWAYSQSQTQAEIARIGATATAAEAIAQLTATAQATAAAIDAATQVAVAIQGIQLAEVRGTQTAEAHRATLIARAGRTATAEAAATKTAQARTATHTPTRTPRPTPTPTATIDADPTVYDNFNNPAFDGKWNTGLWVFGWNSYPYNTPMEQKNGVLNISRTTIDNGGLDAIMPRSEWTIGQINSVEAKVKLDENVEASTGNVGIGISGFVDGTLWWHNCTISGGLGWSNAWASCSTSEDYSAGSFSVEFNTWHKVRFEINPDTAAISFFIDDQQIGNTIPSNPDTFKKAKFKIGLRAWSKDGGAVSGYIDDVRIGKLGQ